MFCKQLVYHFHGLLQGMQHMSMNLETYLRYIISSYRVENQLLILLDVSSIP